MTTTALPGGFCMTFAQKDEEGKMVQWLFVADAFVAFFLSRDGFGAPNK
jgi:hypothetical protein